MTEREKLAREILEHLRFFRELGVERVSRELESPRSLNRESRPPEETPALETAPPKAVHVQSLFDRVRERTETLQEVREDLGDCQRCKLAPSRKNIVFGSGNPRADLMFVGEAPGADEDAQGLPFVGKAGQLLTRIIAAIDMRREDVYICNILKCRPPGNRNPESDEIAACEPFLFRQIAAIQPKVICALGTFGAQTLLRTKEPVSRLRGQFIEFRGAKLMATFHPAYLLRNPSAKRQVWEDVQKIRDYLKSLQASADRS